MKNVTRISWGTLAVLAGLTLSSALAEPDSVEGKAAVVLERARSEGQVTRQTPALTNAEVVATYTEHEDEIAALWVSMGEETTMRQAVEAWLRGERAPAERSIVSRTSPSGELIAFEESYDLGEPIIGRIADLGADADVGVVIREVVTINGVEVIGAAEASTRVVGQEVFAWGKPAKYQAELTAAVIEDGKPKRLRGVAVFVVVGHGPQPPPDPPEPDPVPPTPTGLGALVPDPAHRALLAEFFGDLAAEVRKEAFANTSHFRAGYRKAIADGKTTGQLPTGLSAIDKPVSDRLSAAIGLNDVPLDPALRTALANVLDGIAGEFK